MQSQCCQQRMPATCLHLLTRPRAPQPSPAVAQHACVLRCLPAPCPLPPAWPPLQLAEEEEFEAKRKELEEQASPVFARMYQGAGGAGGMPGSMPGGMPDMGPGAGAGGARPGPTVEEVD